MASLSGTPTALSRASCCTGSRPRRSAKTGLSALALKRQLGVSYPTAWLVGPARHPHLPGLLHEGLDERQLVWIRAEAPSERMWVTEQLIRSNAAGAIVAWLSQARQEQLRRLQGGVLACEGLVFLCRPTAARHEASASPLREHASVCLDWELKVNVFKRRGRYTRTN